MSTLVFQIVTLLVAAFLIGCVAGCAARRLALRWGFGASKRHGSPKSGEAEAGPDNTGDDLTLIAGIGPKTERQLRRMGVRRFADIAAWNEQELGRISGLLKLGERARREKWVEQARQLSGDAGRQPRQKR